MSEPERDRAWQVDTDDALRIAALFAVGVMTAILVAHMGEGWERRDFHPLWQAGVRAFFAIGSRITIIRTSPTRARSWLPFRPERA